MPRNAEPSTFRCKACSQLPYDTNHVPVQYRLMSTYNGDSLSIFVAADMNYGDLCEIKISNFASCINRRHALGQ